jgi:hypothetical protein
LSRRLGALALAVLLAIAGALALGGLGGGSVGDHLPDDPTTTTAPPKPLAQVVAEVEQFVSKQRGLAFKRAVPVQLLDGTKFKARLLADAEDDKADTEVDARVLHALGLIDEGVDLYRVLLRFVGDAVVGFYDTRTHELVVRAGSITPYARATLAHELTHALDDQWFDLERPELDERGNDEAALAFGALVEGDAVRVEDAYRATLNRAERLQASFEETRLASQVDLHGVPDVVPQIISFPYAQGPAFVRALLDAGGERRVDAAFADPPLTSEDVLDPAGWLAGASAVAVAPPKADGPELDHGIYGESTLELTLAPSIGGERARAAADGWGGDRYVAWDAGGGKVCVRARFAMDTGKDLDQLTAALRTWTKDSGATVDRGPTTVAFTVCR